MSFKSHSLNLWTDDDSSKLDIDVKNDVVDITTSGGQSVKINPVLHLVHSSGDIPDVANKINANAQAIIDGNAGSAAAAALVQNNLDAYQTSNNASVATLNSTVVANKAITDAQHTSDASARATLQNDLETKINDEETRATNSESVNSSAISQEISDRQTAVSSEQSRAIAAEATLTAAISVERLRIDAILSGAGVDTDTLKEISDAYANVDANVLNQIADMTLRINALVGRVNSLTSSSEVDFVVALETAISELDLVNNKAFIKQPFSLSFNMLDMFASSSTSMIGWAAYKAVIIATSAGILSNSSSDDDVKAHLLTVLNIAYGSKVLEGSTIQDYRLKYEDNEHYLLETNLTNSKPYFKGVEQTGLPSVNWRLSYCSVAGDDNSIYSTIMSGSQNGKVLHISPSVGTNGIEFPVNGISGVRDGYKTTLLQLSLK